MKYYLYLCTLVETRDYAVGGPKLKVPNLVTVEIEDLQSSNANSKCQKPYLGAKVRLVFTS